MPYLDGQVEYVCKAPDMAFCTPESFQREFADHHIIVWHIVAHDSQDLFKYVRKFSREMLGERKPSSECQTIPQALLPPRRGIHQYGAQTFYSWSELEIQNKNRGYAYFTKSSMLYTRMKNTPK